MSGLTWEWLAPLFLAVALSLGANFIFALKMRNFALDLPNNRSMHSVPVPRTGGWALLIGLSAALLVSPFTLSPLITVSFMLVLAVSALDDLRDVPAHFRLIAHVLAVILLLLALPVRMDWWYYPIAILLGVWTVNLYNFMDGIDGLAGSMTVIGFGSLAGVCFLGGDGELAWVCGLFVICALIFLIFNWPSAKIFLGDAGSVGLGLAVVAVSLFGWQRGAFELWVPGIIFIPFWLDATCTLAKRVLARQRWWEAHQEHFYQRCALRIGVKNTLYLQLTMMILAACAVFAIIFLG
ncbi:MraY family glycosyltransferase [Microbulbifer sp. JMSA003]|uniref:MraY family glycosyltransferase n=1 Tax=Microbulbifer sp. JMSA003 TaxID=3243369 RepID=UPI00403937F0